MAAARPSRSEAARPLRCPSCSGEAGSSVACLACGRILREPEGATLFDRLGLSADEVFDAQTAEARYLRISRILHPDHRASDAPDIQELALENTARLNEAWRTLSDVQLRHEYLLELYAPGSLERHKKLSPDFLLSAMETSEELEDARSSGCQETIRRIARESRQQIEARMHGVASACSATIGRIARDDHVKEAERPTRLLPFHEWNIEQIAVLLHQARVYRRILKDTGVRT